ncbi:hypothetical protein LPJ56_002133 [Coemansia sp. RSA 2599]|nr:hypothetical protein LPJ56_002133 [Coemansia sp. RSA 2599]
MLRSIIAKGFLQESAGSAYQQQYRLLSTTGASFMASKTILHRLSADQPKTESWLEQKLQSERLAKSAESKASTRNRIRRSRSGTSTSIKSSSGSGSGPSSDPGSGFVKIGGSEKKRNGTESSADKDGTTTTLTQKALESKLKWQESGVIKKKMHDILKDGTLEGWKRRKIELKLKLGNEGWSPEKKIAVSSMEKIRLLNAEFPEVWTMKRLSEQFKVSQESIRRIIKSKFRPSAEKIEKREQKRKEQIRSYKLEKRSDGFNSSAIIDQLTNVLTSLSAEDRKKEVNKTKAVYAFEVVNRKGQKHYFVVDLKQAGKVTDGATEAEAAKGQPKPDISITISDETFIKISEGKTTAAGEFMSGKVKIKGNMMLGMKLEPLLQRFKKLAENLPAPSATSSSAPAAGSSGSATASAQDIVVKGYEGSLVIAQILKALGSDEAKRNAALKSTNAIFQIDLKGPEGVKSWVLNLKPGATGADIVLPGTAAQNKKNAGVTLILNDSDFVDLASGKITGQSAFMSGKLKSKGNVMLALKLESVFKATKGPAAKL